MDWRSQAEIDPETVSVRPNIGHPKVQYRKGDRVKVNHLPRVTVYVTVSSVSCELPRVVAPSIRSEILRSGDRFHCSIFECWPQKSRMRKTYSRNYKSARPSEKVVQK